MNRVLYQLSYAAIDCADWKISFVIIYRVCRFVKIYFRIFGEFFGNPTPEVIVLGILKEFLLFILGGSAYVALEWLWRGWSHISMFFAGGTCFLLLGKELRGPLASLVLCI